MALTIAGYDVREAANGFDALRALDADPPDLVILDLLLPRVSGFEVQKEIAANASVRNIPILIVTGSGLTVDPSLAQCVLRKPVLPDQLVEFVRQCLRDSASR